MTEILLIHAPGACSRVTMTALEEIGISYTTMLLTEFRAMDEAEQQALNPRGKVPALRVGDRLLVENAAILYHLHSIFPQARLLPEEPAQLGHNAGLQDLVWCSATLHPMTRMLRASHRYTTSQDFESIAKKGVEYYQPVLKTLSDRFSTSQWWYGDQWSIVDTYLFWNYNTAQSGGLDLSGYPALDRHARDVVDRPAFQRVRAHELAAVEAHDLQLLPGVEL